MEEYDFDDTPNPLMKLQTKLINRVPNRPEELKAEESMDHSSSESNIIPDSLYPKLPKLGNVPMKTESPESSPTQASRVVHYGTTFSFDFTKYKQLAPSVVKRAQKLKKFGISWFEEQAERDTAQAKAQTEGAFVKKNNRIPQKVTNCEHKDRKYYAKGMCNHCYHAYGRTKKATACKHPDRMAYALNKCMSCY